MHTLGLQGRMAGSHLSSMQSMDNDHVSKRRPLMARALEMRLAKIPAIIDDTNEQPSGPRV